MERPRGVKMIYAAGGDPLCTSHRRTVQYSTASGASRLYLLPAYTPPAIYM